MRSSISILFLATSLLTIHLRVAAVIPSILSHDQVLDNSCQCDCCYTISDSRTECVPPADVFFEISSCSLCTVAECRSRFPTPCSQQSSVVHAKCIPQQGVFFRIVPALLVIATLALLVYGFFFKKFDGYHREGPETHLNTEQTTQYNTFQDDPSAPDDEDNKTTARHAQNVTFPTTKEEDVTPPTETEPIPPLVDPPPPLPPVETTDHLQADEAQPQLPTDDFDIDAKVSEAATLGSDSTTARDLAVLSEIPPTETTGNLDHEQQSADVRHVIEHETAAIFEATVPNIAQINVSEPRSATPPEPLSSALVKDDAEFEEPEVTPVHEGFDARSSEQLDPKSETAESDELVEDVHQGAAESSTVSERDSEVAAEVSLSVDTVHPEAKVTDDFPEADQSHPESVVSAPEALSFDVDASVSKTGDGIEPSLTSRSTDASDEQKTVEVVAVTEELTTTLQRDVETPEETQVESVRIDLLTRPSAAVHEEPIAEESRLEASGAVSLPEQYVDATRDEGIRETEETTVGPIADADHELPAQTELDETLPEVKPTEPAPMPENIPDELRQEIVMEAVVVSEAAPTAIETETTSESLELAGPSVEGLEQTTAVLETITESSQPTAPMPSTVAEETETRVEVPQAPAQLFEETSKAVNEIVMPTGPTTTSEITSAEVHIIEPAEHSAQSEELIVEHVDPVEAKEQIVDPEGAAVGTAQAAEPLEDVGETESHGEKYEAITEPATETSEPEKQVSESEEQPVEPEMQVAESDAPSEVEPLEEPEVVTLKVHHIAAPEEQDDEPEGQRVVPEAEIQEYTGNVAQEEKAVAHDERVTASKEEEQAVEPEQVTADLDVQEPTTQIVEPIEQVVESESQPVEVETPVTEPNEEPEYVEEAAERKTVVDVHDEAVDQVEVEPEIVLESHTVEPEDGEHTETVATEAEAVEPEQQITQLEEDSCEHEMNIIESDVQLEADVSEQLEPVTTMENQESAPEEQLYEPEKQHLDSETEVKEAIEAVLCEQAVVNVEHTASEEQAVEAEETTTVSDTHNSEPITQVVEPVEEVVESELQPVEVEVPITEPQEEVIEHLEETAQRVAVNDVQEEPTTSVEIEPEIAQESQYLHSEYVEHKETTTTETEVVEPQEQASPLEKQGVEPGTEFLEAGEEEVECDSQVIEVLDPVQEQVAALENQASQTIEQVTDLAEQAAVEAEPEVLEPKEDVYQPEGQFIEHVERDAALAEPIVAADEDATALNVKPIEPVTNVEASEPEGIDSESQTAEGEKPINEPQGEPIGYDEQVIDPTGAADLREEATQKAETAVDPGNIHEVHELGTAHVEQIGEPSTDISTDLDTTRPEGNTANSEEIHSGLLETSAPSDEMAADSDMPATMQQGVSIENEKDTVESTEQVTVPEEAIKHEAVTDEPEEGTVDMDTTELDGKEQAPEPAEETDQHETHISEDEENVETRAQTGDQREPTPVAEEQIRVPEELATESKEEFLDSQGHADETNEDFVEEEQDSVHHELVARSEEWAVESKRGTADPDVEPSEPLTYDSGPIEQVTESESKTPEAEMPAAVPQEAIENIEENTEHEVGINLQKDTSEYHEQLVEPDVVVVAESNRISESQIMDPETEAFGTSGPVTEPAARFAESEEGVAEPREQSAEPQMQAFEAEEDFAQSEAQAVDKEEEIDGFDAQASLAVGSVTEPVEETFDSKTQAIEKEKVTAEPQEENPEQFITPEAVDNLEDAPEHVEQLAEPEMVVERGSDYNLQQATDHSEKIFQPAGVDDMHEEATEHDEQNMEPEVVFEPMTDITTASHADEPEGSVVESDELVSVPREITLPAEHNVQPGGLTDEEQKDSTEIEEHAAEPEEDVGKSDIQETEYNEEMMSEAEVNEQQQKAPVPEEKTFEPEEVIEAGDDVPPPEARAVEPDEPVAEPIGSVAEPEAQHVEGIEAVSDAAEEAVDPDSQDAEPDEQTNEPVGFVVEPSEKVVPSETEAAGAETLVAAPTEAPESSAQVAKPEVLESELDVVPESHAVECERLVESAERFIEPTNADLSERDFQLSQLGTEVTVQASKPVAAVLESEERIVEHVEQASLPKDDIAQSEQLLVAPEEQAVATEAQDPEGQAATTEESEGAINEPDTQKPEAEEEGTELEKRTLASENVVPVEELVKPEEEVLKSEVQTAEPERKLSEAEEQPVATEEHPVQPFQAHDPFVDQQYVEGPEEPTESPIEPVDAPVVAIGDSLHNDEEPQDPAGSAFESVEAHSEEPGEENHEQVEDGEGIVTPSEARNEPALDAQTQIESEKEATFPQAQSEEAKTDFAPEVIETVHPNLQNVDQDIELEVADQEPIDNVNAQPEIIETPDVVGEVFQQASGQDVTEGNLADSEVMLESPSQEPAKTEAEIVETKKQFDEDDITKEEDVESNAVKSETVEARNVESGAELVTAEQGVLMAEDDVADAEEKRSEEKRSEEIGAEGENVGDTTKYEYEPTEQALETGTKHLTFLEDEEHSTKSAMPLHTFLPLAELEAAEAEVTTASDLVVASETSQDHDLETAADSPEGRVLLTDAETEQEARAETTVNKPPSEEDIPDANPLELTAESLEGRAASVAEILETEPSRIETPNMETVEDIDVGQGAEAIVTNTDTVEAEDALDTGKTAGLDQEAMQAVETTVGKNEDVEGGKQDHKAEAVEAESEIPVYYGTEVDVLETSVEDIRETPCLEESNRAVLETAEEGDTIPLADNEKALLESLPAKNAAETILDTQPSEGMLADEVSMPLELADQDD